MLRFSFQIYIDYTRAVQTHPRPDPSGGSDLRPIRNRPTRSFRRSAADLGFQNPKTVGRLAGFLFKTRRNPTEPRSRHFPVKLFTTGEISARSMESSLDLARSHQIWRDLAESDEISTKSKKIRLNITEISPLNRLILGDFQISTSDRTDRRPLKVRSDQPCRSAAG